MQQASALFRLLGDPTRLRLLRVLGRDRFNVSELTGILGLAQSGVSRHLGLLKDAGLVVEERAGGYAYYRLADPGADGHRAVWPLLDAEFASAGDDAAIRADEARLHEVLRLRKENFESHGDVRQLVPGRSWAAWARALGQLLPALDVVDIGCGEGYLTLEAARWAARVVGIDRSVEVLARARVLARRRRVTNVQWKQGDLARLPLPDASMDVALLSQALHHAPRPEDALREAARVLRPGGRVLVLDLREHGEAWVRDRLGDQCLGFSEKRLDGLLRDAGFTNRRVTVGTRHTGDPFVVLIASGDRTAGAGTRLSSRAADPPCRTSGPAARSPHRAPGSSARSRRLAPVSREA